MDLHLLAATAGDMLSEQTGTGTKRRRVEGLPSCSQSLDKQQGDVRSSVVASGSLALSSDNDNGLHHGRGKQNKHRAAEQRRRERINERLQALRELVPHDMGSNTATFLEGVIAHIQALQHSNIMLEAELAALRTARAAAAAAAHSSAEPPQQQHHNQQQHQQQQQQVVVQPAISNSNRSSSGAQQQQQPYLSGSMMQQDSFTGGSPSSAHAAAAAAGAASVGATPPLLETAPLPHASAAAGGQGLQLQHLQQAQGAPARGTGSGGGACDGRERRAQSSSPPLPPAAAAVAGSATGGTSSTLSAPACLPALQPLADGGEPGGGHTVAVHRLQAAGLQSVLEKALLAALHQQAEQLVAQHLSRT